MISSLIAHLATKGGFQIILFDFPNKIRCSTAFNRGMFFPKLMDLFTSLGMQAQLVKS
jgi:hypothetical protein